VLLLLAAGILLVAIPAAFTIFPGLTRNSRHIRLAVFALWLGAVAILGWASTQHSEIVDAFFGQELHRAWEERFVAGSKAIELVLSNLPQTLTEYSFRLYLFDADKDKLVPSSGPVLSHPGTEWDRDRGATGRAYYLNEYQRVQGAQCWGADWGLTADQQAKYQQRDMKIVAAMPLRNSRRECVGVLSGSSYTDGSHYLASPPGMDQHIELARIISQLVVHLLRGGPPTLD